MGSRKYLKILQDGRLKLGQELIDEKTHPLRSKKNKVGPPEETKELPEFLQKGIYCQMFEWPKEGEIEKKEKKPMTFHSASLSLHDIESVGSPLPGLFLRAPRT